MKALRDEARSRAVRVHLLVGILVVVGLPFASWWSGTGGLAFTMFSGSGSYRLRVVISDESGAERPIAATGVAARARGTIGDVLAGSEAWRFAPFGALVRRRLDQVAALACTASSQSRGARVTLYERRTLDSPVRTTTVTRSCP
jgi:hypothetical protein